MFGVSKGGTRELATLNIPPAILARLNGVGFQRVADLVELQPTELAEETGLSLQEAAAVLKQVLDSKSSAPQSQTAFEILQAEEEPGVLTFVRELDEMLGCGIPRGKITEFCGAPGLGKTQLGIQLAVDVHLPACLDGPFGECIYIDTEGSLMPQRVAEIAESFVERLKLICDGGNMKEEDLKQINLVSVESILSTIYCYRVHNHIEQIALVNILRDEIRNNLKNVKLIVIDSIAFHFRRSFEDYSVRTRLLSNMSQTLIEIAKEFNLAVVVINQVTTKITKGKAELVPALGETWGHSSTNRIMLFEKGGVRFARLLKSPNQKKAECPYQINEQGVRSVADSAVQLGDNPDPMEEEE